MEEDIPKKIEDIETESDHLGPSAPIQVSGDQTIINQLDRVRDKLAKCKSKREALEMEVDGLAECILIAQEKYQENSCPDNAYMLSALQNAKNSSLSQLEKMKDPQILLSETEGLIEELFKSVIKTLMLEIDKTKKEYIRLYPNDTSTTEDMFNRMVQAISPKTQELYSGMHKKLKEILGIK